MLVTNFYIISIIPMSALKEHALGKYTGDLFIREVGSPTWLNMWAVRALVANIDGTEVTEINSDNRGTLIKFTNLKASISVTALETFDRDKLDIIYNTVSSNIAGAEVEVENEAIGTAVSKGTIYTLLNRNGDKTEVDNIVVTDGTGDLTLNTHYTVGVDTEWNTYLVFLSTTTGATVVDYTYTPNAWEQAEITLWTNSLKNFEVKIEAIIPNSSKQRTITLSSATINSTYSLGFQDPIEAGDLAGADIVFEGNKAGTLTYFDEVLS